MADDDKDTLIQGLRRSKIELDLAYDATIEGFARALDLREREPAGHTHQVTEYTLRLAKALAIPEPELVQIKRGALLHDIGKMGIPEHILQKTEPLTDEEWNIICKHPQYAYDLLAPIIYLYPAIDIPYCHHEKWDGTGYPRGLKHEQIPRAARIFVVVDVWDALTTDRPYRKAWTNDKAIQFIHEQAGLYFDPDVVKVFLNMDFKKSLTRPYVK
ncbi:MAG TPA: HD-GYP domain-containing protein [Anaerolineales bacterium]|nr:HD-GYP domain-containing protein [Anaerolineales bacterium]